MVGSSCHGTCEKTMDPSSRLKQHHAVALATAGARSPSSTNHYACPIWLRNVGRISIRGVFPEAYYPMILHLDSKKIYLKTVIIHCSCYQCSIFENPWTHQHHGASAGGLSKRNSACERSSLRSYLCPNALLSACEHHRWIPTWQCWDQSWRWCRWPSHPQTAVLASDGQELRIKYRHV